MMKIVPLCCVYAHFEYSKFDAVEIRLIIGTQIGKSIIILFYVKFFSLLRMLECVIILWAQTGWDLVTVMSRQNVISDVQPVNTLNVISLQSVSAPLPSVYWVLPYWYYDDWSDVWHIMKYQNVTIFGNGPLPSPSLPCVYILWLIFVHHVLPHCQRRMNVWLRKKYLLN